MEDLAVQLDSYSRLGIPKFQHHVSQDSLHEDKVEEGNFLVTKLLSIQNVRPSVNPSL